ncbi:MAG: hypothetical protein KKE37_03530 [Verrucomicrobia bacterium]|nr:hypothetical protein [Verrucomicrobiota bacterium]MBU4290723.1 hypothetical protein [Verrucomicrobiota bacterium]MBU4428410.1 hypothetical protein [Verrucomicrobiota bacterium]MCG2680002.1 hypothetical protein [Kiritimatiellia bacterium]
MVVQIVVMLILASATVFRCNAEEIGIVNLKSELPNLRSPIVLFVDDCCPGINAFYYERRYGENLPEDRLFKDWELSEAGVPKNTKMVQRIPLSFLKEYAEWASQNNVRGKFSVIPFPGGRGNITEGWEDCTKQETEEWIKIVKEKIAPICDITPELLTHSQALDIKSKKLLPIPEWDYTAKLNLDELTEYISLGLKTLKEVGLPATGVTHPRRYKGNQDMLVKAIMEAMKKVTGEKLVFYWVGFDTDSLPIRPRIAYLDKEKGEAVVGMPVACQEPMWKCTTGGGDVSKMADYYLDSDGKNGKFNNWINTGSYLIFYVHWQSLYGNETKKGFLAVQEILKRVQARLGDRVKWMKASECARYFVASQTFEVKSSQEKQRIVLAFNCPFACPDFTVSGEMASDRKIKVTCDGKAMQEVSARKGLKENSWFREGKKIFFSFPLHETKQTKIEIVFQ